MSIFLARESLEAITVRSGRLPGTRGASRIGVLQRGEKGRILPTPTADQVLRTELGRPGPSVRLIRTAPEGFANITLSINAFHAFQRKALAAALCQGKARELSH